MRTEVTDGKTDEEDLIIVQILNYIDLYKTTTRIMVLQNVNRTLGNKRILTSHVPTYKHTHESNRSFSQKMVSCFNVELLKSDR